MAALTPVASSEALVGVIQKSGLLSADALAKVSAAAQATPDAGQLARDLLKAGTLSKWQAGQLLHGYHQLTIGKYKLLEQLESGAIGRVYLAEHAQMGRLALLKVLSKRQSADPATVKRFLTQAQQACGLDHRNISHVYDVNQDDERNYVVVEHVEGTDLARLVEKHGPLPLGEALEYVRQAVEGLIHAHAAGVCHGDLKPANLLLDDAGTIKIIDIGQAGLTGLPAAAGSIDETGEMPVLSNSVFRAPEVAAGQPADKASDIYSLGSVLCFLITGKPATDAAAALEQMRVSSGVPRALAEACAKLMAEKPEDRPANILDAWNLIASAEDPEGVAAQVALASEGNGDGPGPSDSAKGKKPRVAQRLEQLDLQLAGSNAAEESPFAGLVVTPRSQEARPSGESAVKPRARELKRAVALAPAPAPELPGLDALGPLDTAPAAGSLPPAAAPEPESVSPVLIAAALAGGGVLLIGVIAVIWLFTTGQGNTKVAENAASGPAPVVVQRPPAAPPSPEANPQVGGEMNPTISPETNPSAPPPPPAAEFKDESTAALPVNPPATGKKKRRREPPPAPQSTPTETPPVPAVPLETPGEPKVDTKPDAKPEANDSDKSDTKTEPKTDAKPPSKPEAKPAPPKAPPSPFRGFTASVALPQLPESAGQPATDAAAPQSLGPCNVDEKAPLAIALRGGATASRNKHAFNLLPRNGNPREWDFVMAGGDAPLVVATLAAKDSSLVFQWTEQALDKPQDAGYLCNCMLELASGTHRHTAALRTPIEAEPLPVEIDRKGAPERWQIPFLPPPKQVFMEVAKTEGFKQLRLEPDKPVNVGEQVTVWTGPDEKSPLLALRIDTKASTTVISVSLSPHVKPSGSKTTRAYTKKEANSALNQVSQEFTQLQKELTALKEKKPPVPKGKSTTEFNKWYDEITKIKLPNEIADRQALIEQLKFLTQFAEKGEAKIHFRVFHESDAGPIELLKTYVETAPKGKKK